MRKVIIILVSLLVAGCSGSYIRVEVKSDQYYIPYFSGNPERNHFINVSMKDTLVFAWQNEMYGSFGFNTAVGYDSIIFINDLSGKVFAYNVFSGKRTGQVKYRGTVAVSPLIHKNHIIFPVSEYNQEGTTIYSYDFTRGIERFKYSFTGKIQSEGLVAGDSYFFVAENGIIILLDQNGNLLDTEESELYTHSVPVMADKQIYWGTDRGAVLRYNHESKSLSGRLKLSDFPLGHGVVSNGIYYLLDNQGVMYAVSLKDFKLQWKLDIGRKSLAAPVHDGSALWITAQDGSVLKINPEKRSVTAAGQYNEYFNTAPLVLSNVLIFAAHSGNLLVVDKETLAVKQKIEMNSRMKLIPILFKGFLITGYDSGIISVYKITTEP